jgi:hypothetical protein
MHSSDMCCYRARGWQKARYEGHWAAAVRHCPALRAMSVFGSGSGSAASWASVLGPHCRRHTAVPLHGLVAGSAGTPADTAETTSAAESYGFSTPLEVRWLRALSSYDHVRNSQRARW